MIKEFIKQLFCKHTNKKDNGRVFYSRWSPIGSPIIVHETGTQHQFECIECNKKFNSDIKLERRRSSFKARGKFITHEFNYETGEVKRSERCACDH